MLSEMLFQVTAAGYFTDVTSKRLESYESM